MTTSFIFPRGWISGLTVNPSNLSTTYTVSPGQASDSTNAMISNFASTMTKSLSAWSVGNNGGSLDIGTIAASTWYHVHVIDNPSTPNPDILLSLSATAPNLPTGYTTFRRLNSILTNSSSQTIPYVQLGDETLWSSIRGDFNSTVGISPSLITLSTPPGVKTWARIRGFNYNTGTQASFLVCSPDETTTTANSPIGNITGINDVVGAGQTYGELLVRTNLVSQVSASSNFNGSNILIDTFGYVDHRGKDV